MRFNRSVTTTEYTCCIVLRFPAFSRITRSRWRDYSKKKPVEPRVALCVFNSVRTGATSSRLSVWILWIRKKKKKKKKSRITVLLSLVVDATTMCAETIIAMRLTTTCFVAENRGSRSGRSRRRARGKDGRTVFTVFRLASTGVSRTGGSDRRGPSYRCTRRKTRARANSADPGTRTRAWVDAAASATRKNGVDGVEMKKKKKIDKLKNIKIKKLKRNGRVGCHAASTTRAVGRGKIKTHDTRTLRTSDGARLWRHDGVSRRVSGGTLPAGAEISVLGDDVRHAPLGRRRRTPVSARRRAEKPYFSGTAGAARRNARVAAPADHPPGLVSAPPIATGAAAARRPEAE